MTENKILKVLLWLWVINLITFISSTFLESWAKHNENWSQEAFDTIVLCSGWFGVLLTFFIVVESMSISEKFQKKL